MMVNAMNISCPAPAALDLCVRKRTLPRVEEPDEEAKKTYIDNATCLYSPVSNSTSDSEVSDSFSTIDGKMFMMTPPKVSKAASRPFKAYIKDPLTLSHGVIGVDTFRKDSLEAFAEFRTKILSQVQTNNNGTNKNMRRVPHNGPNRIEDPGYWEKRRKNNEAAKRSRDARRAKEDEIAIRCAFLEQENLQLKYKIATLEAERQRLQEIVFHT